MKMLWLILLFCDSLQLRCDRKTIIAHVGGEFLLTCIVEDRFYYSKKYWCRGPSRASCEILADSEGVAKTKYTHRSQVVELRKRVFVRVTNLQVDDSGVYWVGVDKMYSDIMVSVTVNVTQAPVSKPGLRPLISLADRPTCWGQPITVRCGPSMGTAVRYAWYHRNHNKDILLSSSSDLTLNCETVKNGGNHYCLARNDVSSEKSDILSVQVLQPTDRNCIYAVRIEGQPSYDCAERMSTAAATTTKAMAPTTCQASNDQSFQINQTEQDFFVIKSSVGPQLWYSVLRWSLFASLLIFLCVFLRGTRTRNLENNKKKRIFYSRPEA